MAAREMLMMERRLRANAAALVRLVRAPPENLPSKLATLGISLFCAASRAAASPSAEGVQLGAAALAFAAGLCCFWAALWVDADATPRRAAVGHWIFCLSMALLLIAVVLCGFEDAELILDMVFEALA